MPLKSIISLAVFGGELISNPRPVGSPIPSSRALGQRMAAFIPRNPKGYVVELGAGTGSITAALLKRGIPPEKLIVIERSEPMVKRLRQLFPGLTILAGDAAQLCTLLAEHLDLQAQPVSHIVSSLPLRSLPKEVVSCITREIQRLLPPDGRLIQYTYDLRKETNRALSDFTRSRTALVWLNIPPARVDMFRPKAPAERLDYQAAPAT